MAMAEFYPMGLDSHLGGLVEIFEHYGDSSNARIINNLRLKLEQKAVTVACCGYVSAGKSRLLNSLIGDENLLPVSPLPNSKNTVYLRPGKQEKLGLWHKFKPYTNISLPAREQFHTLCQDENLVSLELFCDTLEGLSMIDTPGIDSIEGGKQLATNPALLMTDLVIYVTDYNHVESQVNFSFLKILQSRKIPYLLVVNQTDKHVGLELSLADFRARLIQTLKQWELKPQGLYFTSLLRDEHPECQLDKVRKTLSELLAAGAELVVSTVIRSVKQVLNRHGEFFSAQQDNLREPHLWVKEQVIAEQEALFSFQQLEAQIKVLTALVGTIDSETRTEVDKLLENAPLFSFETRELAKKFLESRQPGFKAGFFASSVRTKAEQNQRLQKLYSELVTRTEANLTWHLRTILTKLPARYNLPEGNYADQVSQMKVQFEPELLLQTVRPGALVSGEYVMNYTRDLAVALKSVYWQSTQFWIDRAQKAAKLKTHHELASLQEQSLYYRQMIESFAKLRELEAVQNTHLAKLLISWEQATALFPKVGFLEDQMLSYSENGIKSSEIDSQSEAGVLANKGIAGQFDSFPRLNTYRQGIAASKGHPRLWKTAQDLTVCAELVLALPGFGAKAEALQQRAARLENNLYTVALFGAFSAGKSSLANAILGDSVLPVSPNPTTSAINKILPPTEQYPHGSIKVKLKSLPDLTSDVLSSLAVFGCSAKNLAEALLQIPTLETLDISLEAKPHLSFLKAVVGGQAAIGAQLGEELTVGFSDFRDFVVLEDKACFVEDIELYFSCPLTELGVVLVDTPGSNSTNVRHTNVAFDYIKNADAVLFVTYYNNPFCKADAQFLSQLGKVKDTFEMDKLFFLVNASDLAQTSEELALVLKHVEQNLRACDLIQPRIFPVSSQLALLAKQASAGDLQPEAEQLYRQRLKISREARLPALEKALLNSGLKIFETSFYSFIEKDLINLAVESAKKEILRILHYVEGLLEAAKTEDSQRTVKLQYYQALEQKILAGLDQSSFLAEESSLSQEIDELFYYVDQRLSHRFTELFNRCFFVLMKPKEEQPKLAVQQCMGELLQEIEVELGQEIRATSLRIESFIRKSLNLVLNKQRTLIGQDDQQCSLQNEHEFNFHEESAMVSALPWERSSLAKVPALYKNPKDWIEGQGRTKMRETVLKILQPQIQTWLKDCNGSFKGLWNEVFEVESKKLKEQTRAEVSGYYTGLVTALGSGYDLNYVEQVRKELVELTDKSV
ncbi:MAG: dynamin family protein [Desulfitobacteriaceae bacterium]